MFKWINIGEAITQTQHSDRTIRRWVKSNESNPNAIKKDGKNIYINPEELAKKYPLKENPRFDRSDRQDGRDNQHTNQMQIVSFSETIKELSKQIERRDDEIKLLLNRKPTSTKWVTFGFVCFLIILTGLFAGYRYEYQKIHEKELLTLKESLESQMKAKVEGKNESLTSKQSLINNQQQIISQQRQELAQKDRLISQLYNDTKAQNKKLSELAESLKNEAIKNGQTQKALPEKEAQKQ